jgi:hypothetical protein
LLAVPLAVVAFLIVGSCACVVVALQVRTLAFVKSRYRIPLFPFAVLNPESHWYSVMLGLTLGFLGPLVAVVPTAVVGLAQIPVLIVRALFAPVHLKDDTMAAEEALAIRLQHWPEADWRAIVEALVHEVFAPFVPPSPHVFFYSVNSALQ